MKIALSGATGFLGQHLLVKLLGDRHDVHALVRSPNKLSAALRENPRLKIFKSDLQGDVSEWVKGADCVIHLAGLIKARSLPEFMAINADAAGHVAKAAHAAKVPRFILLSSMTAREPQLSSYAASKSAGEAAAAREYSNGALAIIRAPAVFGPGDVATAPIFALLNKGLLPVVGSGWKNVRLSMIYIDDLVQDIAAQAVSGAYDGRIVSPSTIASMSWQNFADYAAQALGRPVRVLPVPLFIMMPVAAITSVSLRLFGAGHLTLEKLREFRHADWTSADEIDSPTPMIEALAITAASYKADSDKANLDKKD